MSAAIRATLSAAYYLIVDHALYYLTGVFGVGEWAGQAAKALGFRGKIIPQALVAAFNGFSADGKKPLVQLQKDKIRQPAWDVVLSVPKPLSVLWSVCSPEWRHRVEEIVMQAAKRVVEYLDAVAIFTRRGKNGTRIEKAKGLYGLCPHGTSRELDCQLHVHLLVFNTCLRSDGTTGTILSRHLYLHRIAAGIVFHLELAHLLTKELGLLLKRDEAHPWTFTLPEISPELCSEQSKRRKQIQKIASEEGWTSQRALAELALVTRKAKGPVVLNDCFESWRKTASKFGLTPKVAEGMFLRRQERIKQATANTSNANTELATAVKQSIDTISRGEAYFPERSVLKEAGSRVQGKGYSANQVIAAVQSGLSQLEHYVEIPSASEYRHYSTKENLAAEEQLLSVADFGKDSVKHGVAETSVTQAILNKEKQLSKSIGAKVKLTEDQVRSIEHVTLSPGSIKVIQGDAGTGKTLLIDVAHQAWKEQGYQVFGTSLTGRAAQGLEAATGIPTCTLASLLRATVPARTLKEMGTQFSAKLRATLNSEYFEAKRAGAFMNNTTKQMAKELTRGIKNAFIKQKLRTVVKLTAKSILVVDEAAMLSTKDILFAAQLCEKVGAKLLLVGDKSQLPPIEAGGPFWSIAKHIGYENLSTIVRQRHEWMRTAVHHLINNETQQALELYAKHDSIRMEKHKVAAIERLVTDFTKLPSKDIEKAIALTTTKKEAKVLNAAIQGRRKARNELGYTSLKLPNGERVHTYDVVLFTLNDYRLGLRNGLRGTVTRIERPRGIAGPGTLTVKLHTEQQSSSFFVMPKTVDIDLAKYRDVQLGYTTTTHRVQGITVKESFVLLGEKMQSKEMTITQLTRHQDKCTLYTTEARHGDSLAILSQRISQSVAKDLAHDYTI
jgi:conjugative relaxase-like TrwC/TraI family protein